MRTLRCGSPAEQHSCAWGTLLSRHLSLHRGLPLWGGRGCNGQRQALCRLRNGRPVLSKRGRMRWTRAVATQKPSHPPFMHLHGNQAWLIWTHQNHLLFWDATPFSALFLTPCLQFSPHGPSHPNSVHHLFVLPPPPKAARHLALLALNPPFTSPFKPFFFFYSGWWFFPASPLPR